MTAPTRAKAAGAFNVAAQPVGFLQPLFSGEKGDNQTYLQRLENLSKVAGFDPVAWPERDTVSFLEPAWAEIGSESLWAFQFESEPPLIQPWTSFRDTLNARINDRSLQVRPLLQFDIVQSLSLEEAKPAIYLRAFRAYAEASVKTAERWRDRAILEPILRDAVQELVQDPAEWNKAIRARILNGHLEVRFSGKIDNSVIDAIKRSYEIISAAHSDIFERRVTVEVKPYTPSTISSIRNTGLAIVLTGRLQTDQLSMPDTYGPGIDVVNEEHILPYINGFTHPSLVVILGAHLEWEKVIDTANALSNYPVIIILFHTSFFPLASEAEFQRLSKYTSVGIFAPLSSSRSGNPLSSAQPLINFILSRNTNGKIFNDALTFRHSILLREFTKHDTDGIEAACRLGARALRAGVPPGARGSLFFEGRTPFPSERGFASYFKPLFNVSSIERDYGRQQRQDCAFLLIEQADFNSDAPIGPSQEGIRLLFAMRGWRTTLDGTHLTIEEDNRRFAAIVVDRAEEIPAEDMDVKRPSFGRAPLLVIHLAPRKEALLIGNRGQYFHVSIDDIAFMHPGTSWIWTILRKQLLRRTTEPSLAALRLAASIAAEAIRLDRAEISHPPLLDNLLSILITADCERFIEFTPRGLTHRKATLRVRGDTNSENKNSLSNYLLTLTIADDGPLLVCKSASL